MTIIQINFKEKNIEKTRVVFLNIKIDIKTDQSVTERKNKTWKNSQFERGAEIKLSF